MYSSQLARLYILNDLKKQGFKKVVSVVHKLNTAALKNMHSTGFKEVMKIKAIGIFNKKYQIYFNH